MGAPDELGNDEYEIIPNLASSMCVYMKIQFEPFALKTNMKIMISNVNTIKRNRLYYVSRIFLQIC